MLTESFAGDSGKATTRSAPSGPSTGFRGHRLDGKKRKKKGKERKGRKKRREGKKERKGKERKGKEGKKGIVGQTEIKLAAAGQQRTLCMQLMIRSFVDRRRSARTDTGIQADRTTVRIRLHATSCERDVGMNSTYAAGCTGLATEIDSWLSEGLSPAPALARCLWR